MDLLIGVRSNSLEQTHLLGLHSVAVVAVQLRQLDRLHIFKHLQLMSQVDLIPNLDLVSPCLIPSVGHLQLDSVLLEVQEDPPGPPHLDYGLDPVCHVSHKGYSLPHNQPFESLLNLGSSHMLLKFDFDSNCI